MDGLENTGSRHSRIPHPKTGAAASLQEMTESQHNSRSQSTITRVPIPTTLKRPGTELLPQPETKRQTLADRAGDYSKITTSAPPSAIGAGGVKGVSIASLASKQHQQHARIPKPAASVGALARTTTNTGPQSLARGGNQLAQSIGPGSGRHAFKQSVGRRQPTNTWQRPAASMGQHCPNDFGEEVTASAKQQNGTVTLPSSCVASKCTSRPQDKVPARLKSALAVASLYQHRISGRGLSGGFTRLNIRAITSVSNPGGSPGNNVSSKSSIDGLRDIDKDWRSCLFQRGGKGEKKPPVSLCETVPNGMMRMDGFLSAARSMSPILNVEERLREVESQFSSMKDVMNESLADRKSLEEVVELTKSRANDLQRQKDQLEEKNTAAQSQLDALRQQLQSTAIAVENERRQQSHALDDQAREHLRELDDLRRELGGDLERRQRDHNDALEAMERHYKAGLSEERARACREIQDLQAKLELGQQELQREVQGKEKELDRLQSTMRDAQCDLDKERSLKAALQKKLVDSSVASLELQEKIHMLQAQVDFLKSDSRQQSDQFSAMEARMQQALKVADEARQKLIKEETERRILFNKYQELKGNIRVMCRVRPPLGTEEGSDATIAFPDEKTSSSQIDITGPEEKSSLGVTSRKTNPFEFDRVFGPGIQNEEVFDEISQLVQSALDGYNVCIFCYGQTGSGKTYTMSSVDGMIPRATHMIYDNIKRLEEKSWSYTMEGSFVEVYNEELHDLLSGSNEPKKKLEIRHDELRKTTSVVNCKAVKLDSFEEVESILQLAQSNRSVAATKANERSSRSHSIFILKLVGENAAMGERCQGTLNLVDLAGSERLKHSGAEGDRKKETQNINKSLACLGDVIEALGRGAPHIPYRNSKLTHLLQYSLGGNSKTLMFVMVSPLETHLKETLTSLRFATKVHSTHIGTAKSSKKIKDRASNT